MFTSLNIYWYQHIPNKWRTVKNTWKNLIYSNMVAVGTNSGIKHLSVLDYWFLHSPCQKRLLLITCSSPFIYFKWFQCTGPIT